MITETGAQEATADAEGLAILLAERQLTRILNAYCQGVDRRDWSQVRSCYHDDAVDSHGAYVGDPDGLVDWLARRHEHVLSSAHVLTNISIRFRDDGRMARCESYFLSLQVVDPSNGDPFAGTGDETVFMRVLGRYVDTFERRDAVGWRILRRDCLNDWIMRGSLEDVVPPDPSWPVARRDRTDLLYAPWPGE